MLNILHVTICHKEVEEEEEDLGKNLPAILLNSILKIKTPAPKYLQVESRKPHVLLLSTVKNPDYLNCAPKIFGTEKISLIHIISYDCVYIYSSYDLGRIALKTVSRVVKILCYYLFSFCF